jgi:hypothetical protein
MPNAPCRHRHSESSRAVGGSPDQSLAQSRACVEVDHPLVERATESCGGRAAKPAKIASDNTHLDRDARVGACQGVDFEQAAGLKRARLLNPLTILANVDGRFRSGANTL